MTKTIKEYLDEMRKDAEAKYPLHRLKTEQKLHGVRDRADMIVDAHRNAEQLRGSAERSALVMLTAESAGDFAGAEEARRYAFHQNFFAERYFELALRMTPNRLQFATDYLRSVNDLPTEEECAKALTEIWSANDECWKEYEEQQLRRAQDAINVVRLGHCATTPQGRDVDPAKVAECFSLSREERRARIDAVDRMPFVTLLAPGEEAPTFNPITGAWTGCVPLTDVPEPCPHALPSDERTGRKPGEPRIPGQITPPSVAQAVVDYIEESLAKRLAPFAGKPITEETREKMVAVLKDELEVHLPYEDKPIEIGVTFTGANEPDRIARIIRDSLRVIAIGPK